MPDREAERALLDPFSDEARTLAKDTPPLNQLGTRYIRGCRERLEWQAKPSVDDDGNPIQRQKAPPDSIVSPPDAKFDIAVLYLLMQSCAACFSPTSFEVRTLASCYREIVRRRLKSAYLERREEVVDLIPDIGLERAGEGDMPQEDLYKVMALRKFASHRSGKSTYSDMDQVRFKLRWSELLGSDSELVEFYIKDGWAFLSPNDALEIAAHRTGREIQDYIGEVKRKMEAAGVKPHPIFRRIGEIVSEVAQLTHRDLVAMGGELRDDLFPPCIRIAESGVDAGSRNYAITVLLTSFLSHARISPLAGDAKISDFVDDLSIVTEDILPRIYEAGSRCNPPLFEDQPIEKANILYHLGFGLIQNPRLVDAGNSTWYIPPNCEKIQREVPALCQPDPLCQRIKNPIMYYVIKSKGSDRSSRANES